MPERTNPPPHEPLLDLSRIDDIYELESDGEDVLGELIELFRHEVPPRLQELANALAERNSTRVGFLCHAIRGVCGNLGARRTAQLCTDLQDANEKGDPITAETTFKTLQLDTLLVEEALERIRRARRERNQLY